MRSVEIGGEWFSVVGLGGFELEDDPNWPGARDVLLAAIETGVDWIDTAEQYYDRKNETVIAAALRDVGQRWQAARLDAGADDALDLAQPAHLARRDERDCLTGAPGAAGAPDAMDVGLGALRNVVVDDVRDIGDIEPARRDVGSDEDIGLTAAEAAHDAIALRLGEIAMQRLDAIATGHKRLAQLVDAHLGAAENHRRLRSLGVEDAG